MRKLNLILTSAIFALTASQVHASEVTIPHSFTANTPAVAAQVNANFSAVEAAVDDNYARIVTLQSNPSFTGNLTLVPSTATTGNIMKGTVPFLHDYGTNNTFLGENAGNFTMTGTDNTASGDGALTSNTTGSFNTASGVSALLLNTTGNSNTASGVNALLLNTTGYNNTASGSQALQFNTNGFNNTASGVNALYGNTTGYQNTASGAGALFGNTTGVNNTAVGYRAGYNLTTGNDNIAIAHLGVAADSNTTRIGSIQTRAFIAGIRGVTTATAAIQVLIGTDGQLGTASSSRRVKDDIADMGKASQVLMQLRPVTFHYKSDHNPQGRALQYGLIAEEVAQVAPELVAHAADGKIETVYYQHLTPMLLNEYQKQQHTIAAQTARIAQLEQQALEVAELKRQVAQMAAVLAQLPKPDRIVANNMTSK